MWLNMNMKINYQKKMEQRLKDLEGLSRKKLLIHSCCAPCSSYVLDYLKAYFDITVLFYNPNMIDQEEFDKRYLEQEKIIAVLDANIHLVKVAYDSQVFYEAVKGYEDLEEGQERCEKCFNLRLDEAGLYAKAHGFDFFTTTLSISPMKNAALLNELGRVIGQKHGVEYLESDFKKKNGYKISVDLSRTYDLYRQDYCGCIYSKIAQTEKNNQ